MLISKFRAVVIVFLVGFLLGLSVFAASRLFVRSVLNGDAMRAAEELAARIGSNSPVESSSALSSIVRYTHFDLDGNLVESAAPGQPLLPELNDTQKTQIAAAVARGGAVLEDVSAFSSLIGLPVSANKKVIVPVVTEGRTTGSLLVELDQTLAVASLTRAFSVVAMVTIGLAVLAVITVAIIVTRGRGFHEKRVFDPSSVTRDPLTGVPTRAGFREILDDVVERAAEADRQVLLMVIDLDRFSGVNDIWGHGAGDKVLKMAAERLQALASGPGHVSRIGGDEFALIVEGDATHGMRQLADQIRDALGTPFEIDGSSIIIGASIGTALYPINAEDGAMLFRAAAGALSKAKLQGRNALAVFDTEMKERMQRNEALEQDLGKALDDDELVLFYQPQLELSTGNLRGYEALVRWERREGILAQQDFQAVAEETGLIRPIGEWVLHKACEDAAAWVDGGVVAVNISAVQFRSHDIDKTIAKALAASGLPAGRLEIEVPERLFLEASPDVMDALGRIKALGVRVAMDDFGSNYSALTGLSRFPFDKIKISRSFVSQLSEDADIAAVVSSIVALARTLSADVTAEGVETAEQVTLLKAAGCSIVQGFMFGHPQRADGTAGARSDEVEEAGVRATGTG